MPPDAAGTLVNEVEVEGGGAAAVTTQSENEASAQAASAGFEDFSAELTDADGRPASAADSHPYQYTTSFAVEHWCRRRRGRRRRSCRRAAT